MLFYILSVEDDVRVRFPLVLLGHEIYDLGQWPLRALGEMPSDRAGIHLCPDSWFGPHCRFGIIVNDAGMIQMPPKIVADKTTWPHVVIEVNST